MAEAEVELNTALRNGQADQLNIENVDNDDKVIEMDVALVKVIFYVFTNVISTKFVWLRITITESKLGIIYSRRIQNSRGQVIQNQTLRQV